jgi:two-component system LytT family sensor kinase
MSKSRITYIHIFIWLFAIFANLPYSVIGQSIQPKMIVSSIIGFLYLMVVFYVFYLVLIPILVKRKKLIEFFAIAFLVVLIMPFFGYTILFFSRALFEGSFENFYRGYSVRTHMSGYYPVLTAAVFGSFFGIIINWFKTVSQKAELDKQKIAVELDLLKSKLNPHFLFNTLNNIDSLIKQNPEQASAALIRLSDMMRYLTYETSAEKVELRKEAEYIQNFIELHRIRISSPDEIKFEVSGDTGVMITPALFVPLIENGFKFASFRKGRPAIDILIRSEKGMVDFEISNKFDNNSNTPVPERSGFGLLNLRKRLDLSYPGKYQLFIKPGELVYHVKLTIDTNGN